MEQKRPFVGLRSSLQTLERIACSVKYNEPVLLVGETGTGKTTLVQNLATWLGHPLTVLVCHDRLIFHFVIMHLKC
jgi:midasin